MTNPNIGNPSTNFEPAGVASTHKESKKLGKVYVWELPVRIFHWVNAISIVLLMITGIYIGNPFVGTPIPEEAYYSYVMGWVRYIHFFVAFVFTANLIFRTYWFVKGNEYAKTNPFRKMFWKDLLEVVKSYLFMKNNKKHEIGHNKLAQLSYIIFIGLGSVIMILTGFFLYFEPQFESVNIAKIGLLFGGDSFTVRSFHHIVAWGFMLFMVIHIYMSFREDWLSRNGTMSSIVTGYKTEEMHNHDENDKKPEGDRSVE